ncbi:protease HtpX homolog isoform X2 [Macadamia integrifolia]|uniref:protease HtpX homolog isoform X2 n=1 Tax=Macadamia integrifolia TaxID=60698 RepID=UPI001C50160C|nr:protease HtpX homolog isoform X2 [Macadamia integrifolia]
MASVSLSSFFLTQKPSSLFLTSTDRSLFVSHSLQFRSTKTKKYPIRFSVCRAGPVVFRNLDADDFRHPLDKQLPDLHQLMVEAAEVLNVEAPNLYVRQNPVPNAYTLAVSGRKPFVVVHTSLVELLTKRELQAVLAHELGHLKCDHGVWLTFANILTLGAYTVPGLGGLIAQRLEEQLFRWLRAAELTCDRAALLVAQDPKVVISVLMKLAGGCPSLSDQLNVDAFLEQARSYEKASASPIGWYVRNAQTRQLSHPLPVLRAREIDEWSRSQEYISLLRRSTPIKTAQNM